jgi:hypothetical protein
VRSHRTCVFGDARLHDRPALSVVYYVQTAEDELLVPTTAGPIKSRAVVRNPKISLCVLDERWPWVYLQVSADAMIDSHRALTVADLLGVAGRMSGGPVSKHTHHSSSRWPTRSTASRCIAGPTRLSLRRDP